MRVAACCRVLQCVAKLIYVVGLGILVGERERQKACVLQCVAVCCSVLQCVAVCCSVGWGYWLVKERGSRRAGVGTWSRNKGGGGSDIAGCTDRIQEGERERQ